jgi:hypothetical protein
MNPFQNAKVILTMGAALLLVVAFSLNAQESTPLATALRTRAAADEKVIARLEQNFDHFRVESIETVYMWSVRRLEAERAVDPAGEVAILEAHLALMRKLADQVEALAGSGRVASWDPSAAEFYRAEAEAWLAQAKAK